MVNDEFVDRFTIAEPLLFDGEKRYTEKRFSI